MLFNWVKSAGGVFLGIFVGYTRSLTSPCFSPSSRCNAFFRGHSLFSFCKMFIEDINLDEELSTGLITASTTSTYNTYIKEFLTFIRHNPVENFNEVPVEAMKDDNVAKYLVFLAQKHNISHTIKKNNYKPPIRSDCRICARGTPEIIACSRNIGSS